MTGALKNGIDTDEELFKKILNSVQGLAGCKWRKEQIADEYMEALSAQNHGSRLRFDDAFLTTVAGKVGIVEAPTLGSDQNRNMADSMYAALGALKVPLQIR